MRGIIPFKDLREEKTACGLRFASSAVRASSGTRRSSVWRESGHHLGSQPCPQQWQAGDSRGLFGSEGHFCSPSRLQPAMSCFCLLQGSLLSLVNLLLPTHLPSRPFSPPRPSTQRPSCQTSSPGPPAVWSASPSLTPCHHTQNAAAAGIPLSSQTAAPPPWAPGAVGEGVRTRRGRILPAAPSPHPVFLG